MKNLTEQIVERVHELETIQIPDPVYHAAKRALLDYCGVVINGAGINASRTNRYLDAVKSQGTQCGVFGIDRRADLYSAALLNGMNAHVIELDDGHRFGMMHMGAPVISAVLGAAELYGAGGEKQLRSIIAGYEVAITLARHMQPGHKLKGYHATGTCCTVGCAMAVAVLLDYTLEQIQGALSAAATSAAGLLEVIDDASQLKPYNIGRAAMDGIAAAFTGAAGYRGPNDIIGGKRGFYAVLADEADYKKLKNTELFAREDYAIEGIYYKPYAACRHCHPAIEATLNIRREMLRDNAFAADITRIAVKTYKLAIGGHDHKEISGVSSAKMSTPYSMAAALLTGEAGTAAYGKEMLEDASIGEIIHRIEICDDPELDKLVPAKRAAIVEATRSDGKTYTSRVDYPRGEPENPISDEELENKVSDLFKDVGRENAGEVIACVWNYEEASDKLTELLK